MNALKLLFNPIFLLAAGLHAGLLLIPVAGGSPDTLVPAPDPEGESISVTRIPPNATTATKPNAAATRVDRPATAPGTPTQAAAVNKTAPQQRTAAQQPRTQASRQRPTSGNASNNRANNSSRNGNQPDQTARTTPTPGLPNLPSSPNTVPVTVAPGERATPTPPTLTALRDGATTQRVPQVLKSFLARFQYSLQETRDIATAEAQRAWLAKLEEQPDLNVLPPEALEKSLEIDYPLQIEDNGPRQINACLSPLPKTGLIGVVIDGSGKMTTDPELLRSSGYPFLNEIALANIKSYDSFPNADSQKIYTVPVDVNYNEDACVSLAKLGGAASITPQQTPPTPPAGSRNFLEEDDSPSPFRR